MTFPEIARRILFRLQQRCIHLPSYGKERGRALISYITLPYLRSGPWNSHTNYWEGRELVEAFREYGYSVDLIDSTNTTFVPRHSYDFFIDNNTNMTRLAPLVGKTCVKILYITNAEPKFQNAAARKRSDDLFSRRGIRVAPERNVPEAQGIEHADIAVALGNDFTINTYAYAGKPIVRVPISTTHQFPSPDHKNFEKARHQFLWMGGAGLLHKGLDLVLEAFSQMPQYRLIVHGKIQKDDPLARAYARELYETPNIEVRGFVDPGSPTFATLCKETLGVVFVSASEGGGGSVILPMHAGLIPIVNQESSVDVVDFGVMLRETSVPAIMAAVEALAAESKERLETRAVGAWSFARAHHTRELYAKNIRALVDTLVNSRTKK